MNGHLGSIPLYRILRMCSRLEGHVKMATSKQRRTDLMLGQMLEIVSVMATFQSTISKIPKSKDVTLKEADENKFATRRQKRACKEDDVDAALYTRFVDTRVQDNPITSVILKENANLPQNSIKIHIWVALPVKDQGTVLTSSKPTERRKTKMLWPPIHGYALF